MNVLQRLLPNVDVFLPSIEEIAFMLDRDMFEDRKAHAGNEDPVLAYTASDCSALSGKLLEMGVAVAAIKKGIHGYYLRTADQDRFNAIADAAAFAPDRWSQRELWAPSYKAEIFGSATGAGDATIAGFLASLLRGLTPVESVKVANMLGWQNVREVDAISGIEDWSSTLDMLQSDKPLNSLLIDDPQWQYCKTEKVYYGPNDKENN